MKVLLEVGSQGSSLALREEGPDSEQIRHYAPATLWLRTAWWQGSSTTRPGMDFGVLEVAEHGGLDQGDRGLKDLCPLASIKRPVSRIGPTARPPLIGRLQPRGPSKRDRVLPLELPRYPQLGSLASDLARIA